MTRRTERHSVEGPNSLWQLYRTISFWKMARNFAAIQIGRYCPSVRLKNGLYRAVLGMEIGEKSAFALMAMPDVMYPERIRIGANTIIGYNATLLAHEYLTSEYRIGDIVIGDDVMIGANSTVLPGVEIGDGAIVSAMTLVHRDVPAGCLAGGNPMRIIYTKEERAARERDMR